MPPTASSAAGWGRRVVRIAIDCGGSKGRIMVDLAGRRLAEEVSGSHNPSEIGLDAAAEKLRFLVDSTLGCEGGLPASCSARVAVAGAGKHGVKAGLRSALKSTLGRHFSKVRVEIASDVGAVVDIFLGDTDGIALIAGTGSVCVGVGHKGKRRLVRQVGGEGGYLDAGGGFVIGTEVLRVMMQTAAGCRAPGEIENLVRKQLGMQPGIAASLFKGGSRGAVAGLVPLALEAYERGDKDVRAIVKGAVTDLVGMVEEARKRAGLASAVPVVATGGLFRSPVIERLFRRRLKRALPGVRLRIVRDMLPHLLPRRPGPS